MTSVSDGQWVITIGQWGWVGYLALFGLLCLPVLALWWRYRQVPEGAIPPQVGVLALILGASLVDLLPNATLVSLTWLIAGALLGMPNCSTGAAARPNWNTGAICRAAPGLWQPREHPNPP